MGRGRRRREKGRARLADDSVRLTGVHKLGSMEGHIFRPKSSCFAVERGSLFTLRIMWVYFSKRAYTPGGAVTQQNRL
jgi:hypothetical protein